MVVEPSKGTTFVQASGLVVNDFYHASIVPSRIYSPSGEEPWNGARRARPGALAFVVHQGPKGVLFAFESSASGDFKECLARLQLFMCSTFLIIVHRRGGEEGSGLRGEL